MWYTFDTVKGSYKGDIGGDILRQFLTFTAFSIFSNILQHFYDIFDIFTFKDVLLQISGATCIPDAVFLMNTL